MVLTARRATLLLAFLMVSLFAIAVAVEEKAAYAHGNHGNTGAGCAKVMANPTDGVCQFYAKSRHRYFHWDNDRYADLYYAHRQKGNYFKARVMKRAAQYTCRGALYEDFSCGGYKK